MAIGNEKKRIPFEKIIEQSICELVFAGNYSKTQPAGQTGRKSPLKKKPAAKNGRLLRRITKSFKMSDDLFFHWSKFFFAPCQFMPRCSISVQKSLPFFFGLALFMGNNSVNAIGRDQRSGMRVIRLVLGVPYKEAEGCFTDAAIFRQGSKHRTAHLTRPIILYILNQESVRFPLRIWRYVYVSLLR